MNLRNDIVKGFAYSALFFSGVFLAIFWLPSLPDFYEDLALFLATAPLVIALPESLFVDAEKEDPFQPLLLLTAILVGSLALSSLAIPRGPYGTEARRLTLAFLALFFVFVGEVELFFRERKLAQAAEK